MTVPSRDVARHYHEHHDWWLVAETDDVDIWTYRTDGGGVLVRVLDSGGTRVAHSYVVQARDVVRTVAAHLAAPVTDDGP
jgi:hypothetical protein